MAELLRQVAERGLESSFLFWDVRGHYALAPLEERVNFILKGDDIPGPEIRGAAEILEMDVVSVVSCAPKLELAGSTLGQDYWIRSAGIDYVIEYCPMGVTKAEAISTLMRHVGVEPESCAFIGDGDNDVESMELCDVSFAVGNATNFVKRHAKWILHLNYCCTV